MGSPCRSLTRENISKNKNGKRISLCESSLSGNEKEQSGAIPNAVRHFHIAPGWNNHERRTLLSHTWRTVCRECNHTGSWEHGALRWNVAAKEVVESSVLQPVCHFVHCLLVFEEIYGGFMVALFAWDFRYLNGDFVWPGLFTWHLILNVLIKNTYLRLWNVLRSFNIICTAYLLLTNENGITLTVHFRFFAFWIKEHEIQISVSVV